MLIRAQDPAGAVQNLKVDAQGNLKTSVTGAGSGGTSSNFGDALPVAGSAAGFQKTSDGTMRAAQLDDAGNLKITGGGGGTPAGTAVLTNLGATSASQTALAANANRLQMVFVNDCDKNCYLKYGTTASATSFTRKLLPGENWEPKFTYTGRVDVIWDAGPTGSLRTTELSA